MMTGANARTVPGLSTLHLPGGCWAECWNAECQHGEVAQFNLIICIVSSSLRHHLSSIHPGLVTLDISSVNVINAINTVINIIILPAALTSVAVGLVQV